MCFAAATPLASMTSPLTLSCQCGCVQGEIRSAHPVRIVCYCDDCQKFAAWALARNPTTAQSIQPVNELGGTDILKVFKSEITITTGADKIKLAKLSHKSSKLRAFSTCCSSPLFNLSKSWPFVGVITSAIREPKANLGEVKYRVRGKFAKRPPPDNVAQGVPMGMRAEMLTKAITNWPSKGRPAPINLNMGAIVVE